MMILMAIIAVLCFLSILSFDPKGIITGWLYGVAYGYAFVVLYSIMTMYREESEGVAAAPHNQDTKA